MGRHETVSTTANGRQVQLISEVGEFGASHKVQTRVTITVSAPSGARVGYAFKADGEKAFVTQPAMLRNRKWASLDSACRAAVNAMAVMP